MFEKVLLGEGTFNLPSDFSSDACANPRCVPVSFAPASRY